MFNGTRVTVDSISCNGIIAINVLGDSHFSYIKSHMLSISYNDTKAAKNNSNNAVQIYKHIFSNSVSTHDQPVLTFTVFLHFYTVKLKIVNITDQWLKII